MTPLRGGKKRRGEEKLNHECVLEGWVIPTLDILLGLLLSFFLSFPSLTLLSLPFSAITRVQLHSATPPLSDDLLHHRPS